jgi:glycosyltransferase involved in cell wall biosynthesis
LSEAVTLLKEHDVRRADVLHTIGLEDHVVALLAELGVPYDVTFLDYHMVALHPHIMDSDIGTSPHHGVGDGYSPPLRPAPHPVIANARRLLSPSGDHAERLRRLVPGLEVTVVRPPERPDPKRRRVTPFAPLSGDEPLRILFLGNFLVHKGSEILLDVAALAAQRGAPLEFHALGGFQGSVPPGRQSPATLRLHGSFAGPDLTAIVCAIRPHAAWFPAKAHETYGFALSEAMILGLPILARGMGAYAERLAGRAFTWIVPAEEDNTAQAWLDRLVRLRRDGFPPVDTAASRPPRFTCADGFYDGDYLKE